MKYSHTINPQQSQLQNLSCTLIASQFCIKRAFRRCRRKTLKSKYLMTLRCTNKCHNAAFITTVQISTLSKRQIKGLNRKANRIKYHSSLTLGKTSRMNLGRYSSRLHRSLRINRSFFVIQAQCFGIIKNSVRNTSLLCKNTCTNFFNCILSNTTASTTNFQISNYQILLSAISFNSSTLSLLSVSRFMILK